MTKNPYPGKVIVFEGIDGAGTETQSKLLFNYFKNKKRAVEILLYPDYKGPIGKLIHQYLYKQYDFSVEVQFLLYFVDFIKDREKINQWLKEGKIVISDRYFTSTIAYQGLRGFGVEKALKFAKIFDLPKPDFIVYLKISPETSMKRKYEEKRSLDRNEENKKFLGQLAKFYEKLIKNQIFGKWKIIDGEKPIEEVFSQIKEIVLSSLFNKIKKEV